MRVPSIRALCIAGVAVTFAACRSPQEPTVGRPAELLGARIPTVVAPGTAFRVVAYFGRGACEAIEPVTELTPSEVSIGMRLRPIPVPAGTGCPLILVSDSVVVTVAPPIELPYTVRLQRAQLPDSVVVVRASEPAG